MKKRLDELMVERNLAESRDRAKRLIMAGKVRIDDHPVTKAGFRYPEDCSLQLDKPERFVGRGGYKLEGGIEHFQVELQDCVCLDIGSSTGGFTDCMLQHGAKRVYAVDVGSGQLDWRLRRDERVFVREGINARYLSTEEIGEPVDFVSVDVAFISLKAILPPLAQLVRPGGRILSLIKPQFEARRDQVCKGGVVRDPAIREEVVEKIRVFGTNELKFSWLGHSKSPLKGPAGNQEFLAYWEVPRADN